MSDAEPEPQGKPDEKPAEKPDGPSPETRAKRNRWLIILAAVVVVLALLWGVYYLVAKRGRVHTDDAYVGADVAQVTPLVNGAVLQVRVANTQAVKAGDVLVVIDDADARIAYANAEAALKQATQRFGQSSANTASAQGRLQARAADVAQAQARLRQADAALSRAQTEFARRAALSGTGAVSGEELTTARTNRDSAIAQRDLARAAVGTATATEAAARGDYDAAQALVRGTTVSTTPDVAAAQARLNQARLDLDRTVIRAPIAGVVTARQVQIGQRIVASTPIMTIVPVDAAFVDANFKEGQLRNVRPGMPVEVTSDFYGGDVVFHGRVKGFAGGTGAAFALIPAQNATGNWVKVVQRLPVRITLDAKEVRAHPLRVGLSMDAIIDTRGH